MVTRLRGVVSAVPVVVLVAVVLAGSTTAAPAGTAGLLPPDGTQLEPDGRSLEVRLDPNGTAVWSVEFRMALDDPGARSSYRSAEQRVESEPLSLTGPFSRRMQGAADLAAAETGREMTIRNVTVSAVTLPNGFGVVAYRFEWTGFAARQRDRLLVEEQVLDGFFLDTGESTLLIEWPASFTVEEVSPEPDERGSNTALWRGPEEFGTGGPRVVLSGGPWIPVVPLAGLLALVALVVGAVGWRYRQPEDAPTAEADASTTDGTAASGATAGAGAGAEDDDASTEGEPEPPPELLSNEERVLRLLEGNGGRMKQQDVVETLEWSETKTSQVVRDLREDDRIEVYRLGRENVLSLPGEMDV